MSENTKKRPTYHRDVVEVLSKEYCVSERFVRMAVSGDAKSLTAETIRKKYSEMTNPVKKAIEQFKSNPTNN